MLPSFVIGLREGLEAALIVGIIAAFLRKQGRKDLLRWVLLGVGVAVLLCLGIGIALQLFSQNLPQREQEGLETVIAVLAIGMVTYMVVWMRRNSRNLKGQLEGLAAGAMDGTSNAGRAMIAMAFLAVIREGLETVVFLLAAFNESSSGSSAGVGAALGILIAVGLGYGIYRGGVRLNLSKFFRATGLVLVLVAAGLVVNALHTAHEAGWLDAGQQSTIDLSWLVQPGSVQASLLTGMLGLQPHPVVIEVVGWLVYLIPVGLYVAWPPGRPAPSRSMVRGGLAVGVLAAVAAILLTVLAPSKPTQTGIPAPGNHVTGTYAVLSHDGTRLEHFVDGRNLLSSTAGPLAAAGTSRVDGLSADRYTGSRTSAADGSGRPARLSVERVAQLNDARPPIGITITGGTIPVTYRDTTTASVLVDARTGRVLANDTTVTTRVVAGTAANNAVLSTPVSSRKSGFSAAETSAAVADARHARDDLVTRSRMHTIAGWLTALAVLALVVALAFWLLARRRIHAGEAAAEPARQLARR